MLALSFSAGMLGIEGYVVRVEADSSAGSPHFAIIGLPDRALGEARERVRAAIFHSGFAYPAGRLLVNLSPADVRPCTSERHLLSIESQDAALRVRSASVVTVRQSGRPLAARLRLHAISALLGRRYWQLCFDTKHRSDSAAISTIVSVESKSLLKHVRGVLCDFGHNTIGEFLLASSTQNI